MTSYAEVADSWHKQSSAKVCKYKQEKPDLRDAVRCADCETPPPPPGSMEGFTNRFPREWLAVFATAVVVYLLITLY